MSARQSASLCVNKGPSTPAAWPPALGMATEELKQLLRLGPRTDVRSSLEMATLLMVAVLFAAVCSAAQNTTGTVNNGTTNKLAADDEGHADVSISEHAGDRLDQERHTRQVQPRRLWRRSRCLTWCA